VLFAEDAPGLVCVVLSCLLTRGCGTLAAIGGDAAQTVKAAGVLADVDAFTVPIIAQSGLIGSYSYASQELVSLLLSGRASSNVFNGQRTLTDEQDGSGDEVVLKGVAERCDVGFLSVLGPLELMELGSHVTCPRAPVWVCFGESHYSVLLAAPKQCTWPTLKGSKPKYTFGRKRTGVVYAASSTERCVGLDACGGPDVRDPSHDGTRAAASKGAVLCDVIYVDGLAKQDELIRLTVEVPPSCVRDDSNSGLTTAGLRETEASALDLWVACLGTGGGRIASWNDTEPWEAMRLEMKNGPRK
jgi:hypothetical protein